MSRRRGGRKGGRKGGKSRGRRRARKPAPLFRWSDYARSARKERAALGEAAKRVRAARRGQKLVRKKYRPVTFPKGAIPTYARKGLSAQTRARKVREAKTAYLSKAYGLSEGDAREALAQGAWRLYKLKADAKASEYAIVGGTRAKRRMFRGRLQYVYRVVKGPRKGETIGEGQAAQSKSATEYWVGVRRVMDATGMSSERARSAIKWAKRHTGGTTIATVALLLEYGREGRRGR